MKIKINSRSVKKMHDLDSNECEGRKNIWSSGGWRDSVKFKIQAETH